jgi:hypothetical protein
MHLGMPPLPGIVSACAFCLAAMLLAAAPSRAQNPTGSLRGLVQDTSHSRIPSARITARAAGLSIIREATSDDRGEFRIDDLVPGTFYVVVIAAGFAEASSDVRVRISSVLEMNVTMIPAVVRQSVTVRGQASSITTQPLDAASAGHQAVVTALDLETIPLAARSFANIAYLAPGTEPVEPSDPTKARITAVSTGGSSGLNNELSVDGGDNSDDYIGGFLQNFSPNSIQEFAVRTASEDANTGRTTAGSVVITTKRGTDQWHGDAAFYERAAALNARFPIDNPRPNPKQPFSRRNYAGALGGPIKSGKLWFFSSFEYVNENASIAYGAASQEQFNALAQLAAQRLVDVDGTQVNSIAVPSSVSVPFRDYLGLARLDWAQSQRSQWFLRAANDDYTTRNAFVQEGTLPSTGASSHNNYLNLVIGNQFTFSPTLIGSFVFDAGGLHLTEGRNSHLGFALAFPFSSTSSTISGLETFGDNQFITVVTAFPVLRNQEKYQFRYDVGHTSGRHAPRFGVNFIHEPVLGGALTGNQETLVTFRHDPAFYLNSTAQFRADLLAGSVTTPASDGSFSQNIQRLGLYAEDSWRLTQRIAVIYGLRYDTTFGLFTADGRSQAQNSALLTLQALQIPLTNRAPRDYRGAVAPRLSIAFAPGNSTNTVIRAGFGMFYNDLAQNGWVNAFQAVNAPSGPCAVVSGELVGSGCIPPGGSGALIGGRYRTPYAIHATAGIQYAFNSKWMMSADYTHEQGNHGYRRYELTAGSKLFAPNPENQDLVPNISEFRSDNRSSYNAVSIHLQGNVSRGFNLIANYTLSRAQTWGCVLGELFDYVNGVCDPLNAFAKGDYGPSGEDVTHRFVLAGTLHIPGGFELTTLTQAESARPFTITTADNSDRISINGVKTSLDEFRGTPYIQADLRVSRPIHFRERWTATPFIEFFNLFNRNNPGANFVTNIAALPVTQLEAASGNVTTTPVNQLRVPGGALGDFFGPGTTVGIPFAAQLGVRVAF